MYSRLLKPLKSYSFFLFGARGTGKTTLLNFLFNAKNSIYYDLLDIELEDRLGRNPKLLFNQILSLPKNIKYIIIDEIQKLPKLLDLIHQFMNKNKKRFVFILTGSSARKLKRGGANLLAGRAFIYNLFPLIYNELGNDGIRRIRNDMWREDPNAPDYSTVTTDLPPFPHGVTIEGHGEIGQYRLITIEKLP